jgi:hypothetical protein
LPSPLAEQPFSGLLVLSCSSRRPPKHWYPFTKVHGMTSQTIIILILVEFLGLSPLLVTALLPVNMYCFTDCCHVHLTIVIPVGLIHLHDCQKLQNIISWSRGKWNNSGWAYRMVNAVTEPGHAIPWRKHVKHFLCYSF